MTASDPRVGEIQATVPLAYRPENRQAATDDLIRMLTESADIPGNVNLPREAVDMILAELRDRDEKLAKVEALADEFEAAQSCDIAKDQNMQFDLGYSAGRRSAGSILRAAVATANGGDEQCLSVHAGRQCLLRPGHAPVTGQTYGHIYPAEDS